jgi:hypothetical protein
MANLDVKGVKCSRNIIHIKAVTPENAKDGPRQKPGACEALGVPSEVPYQALTPASLSFMAATT